MRDSVRRAFQCDSAEEEDDENHVGKDCGDVNDFSALGDALHHAQIDQRPCDDQRQPDREVELFRLVNARRRHECLSVPVVLSRRRVLEGENSNFGGWQ